MQVKRARVSFGYDDDHREGLTMTTMVGDGFVRHFHLAQ
jgi:hypothetical protein